MKLEYNYPDCQIEEEAAERDIDPKKVREEIQDRWEKAKRNGEVVDYWLYKSMREALDTVEQEKLADMDNSELSEEVFNEDEFDDKIDDIKDDLSFL